MSSTEVMEKLAREYAEREFHSWKQQVIKTNNPTLSPRDPKTCFKAGFAAALALAEPLVSALREINEEICDGGGTRACSQMWYQDVASEALVQWEQGG